MVTYTIICKSRYRGQRLYGFSRDFRCDEHAENWRKLNALKLNIDQFIKRETTKTETK